MLPASGSKSKLDCKVCPNHCWSRGRELSAGSSPPAGFALAPSEGGPIAAGLAVSDGRWLGLFEINVAAAERRRGVGRRLSTTLLGWGAAAGAWRAYLQVVHDNHPAQALYRSLGFEPVYRYWYRRAPTP